MKELFLILILILVFVSGCATATKSIVLGVSVGATGGHAARYRMGGRDKDKAALQTALLFGLLGGLGGYFTHRSLEKRDAGVKREALFNLKEEQ